MEDLVALLPQMNTLPRNGFVKEVRNYGDIDSLTQIKTKLVSEFQKYDDFPKGDTYSRRKRKTKSAYTSLEERLARDIFELYTYLDTGVVSSGVKNMFKSDGSNSGASFVGEFSDTNSQNNVVNTSTLINDAQGDNTASVDRNCCEQFAKLEPDIFLFKESTRRDIFRLEKKLSEEAKLIFIQDEQISDLLKLNANFQSYLKGIRRESSNSFN